ncbi:AAA family ATPase [Limnobacter alexandrii]|uniref:AAA family ATPase n=1 Tax=Limnobacter alexandrii TaxID=2570352 RepID=UPI0011096AF5|nr:ATP-binding protein [Limnobacter alexandrii]
MNKSHANSNDRDYERFVTFSIFLLIPALLYLGAHFSHGLSMGFGFFLWALVVLGATQATAGIATFIIACNFLGLYILWTSSLQQNILINAGSILFTGAAIFQVSQFVTQLRSRSKAAYGDNGETSTPDAIQFNAVRSTKNFSHLAGMSDLKVRLVEVSKSVLDSKSSDRRNGILLHGEPGNGKTEFALALAGELSIPIISVSIADLASKWVNQTSETLNKVFADAATQQPCLLFIDEIDSVIKDRTQSSGDPEAAKVTNTFLTNVVKLRESKVIVIAATNYIDQLDPAAVREGRFDFKIEVPPPDMEARLAILRHSLKGLPSTSKLEEASLQSCAKRWEGYSASRLAAIGKESVKMALSQKTEVINLSFLKSALRNLQGSSLTMPEGTLTLDQLYMQQSTKRSLESLALRLVDYERIESLGGTMPTGILFTGPSGTGKTTAAKAFALQAKMPLVQISTSELTSNPKLLRKTYERAKSLRPCLVFIDEADDLLGNRSYSNMKVLTNELLQIMDGAGGKSADIVWIAATNFPENLDPACLRGGRFTEKVAFELPDSESIASFIKSWLSEKNVVLADTTLFDWFVSTSQGQPIPNIAQALQSALNDAIIAMQTNTGEIILAKENLDQGINSVYTE